MLILWLVELSQRTDWIAFDYQKYGFLHEQVFDGRRFNG